MTTSLEGRIKATPFRTYAHQLLDCARPAVELHPEPAPRGSDPGASRFGGLPDVAHGFRWPRGRQPFSFLVQLDLAEIAALPAASILPPSGLLSFYCDAALGPRRARVIYTPPDVDLHRVSRPPGGIPPELVFPEAAIRFEATDTLPSELPIYIDDLAESDQWPEDLYEEALLGPDADPLHQLFGFPRPIQNDLGGVASGRSSAWVSLLQLDSDARLGTMWGDAGKLHWLIGVDDLIMRRFDRVVFDMQCC